MFRVFVLQAKLTTVVLFVYYTKGISSTKITEALRAVRGQNLSDVK